MLVDVYFRADSVLGRTVGNRAAHTFATILLALAQELSNMPKKHFLPLEDQLIRQGKLMVIKTPLRRGIEE